MLSGLQDFSSGTDYEAQKAKLEYFLAYIEQKFDAGFEYQINDQTLSGIIAITKELSGILKSSDDEIQSVNFDLRTKCSAALSLFEQPIYREIYIEKLYPIRSSLRYLISLL